MSVKTIKQNKVIWHHINKVDDEALEFLKMNFKFHPMDIKDVKGEAEESKVDVYNNYLFLILQFPNLNRYDGRIDFMELDIFLGDDFIITIQKNKLKAMRNFYYKIQNSAGFRKSCFSHSCGYLLYRILDKLYLDTKPIINYISKKVRQLEDQVYSEEVNQETAREIAYLRRKILALKRIFEPQREVFETLSKLKTKFFSNDLDVYFDDIDDYVEKVWNFLDNRKYAMKDLLEVHDSLLTHTTNRIIKVLTIISVGMLPLTLLSGIYGMNINLPFSDSPLIIWMMFILVLFFVFITIFIFKRKRWL